MDQDLKEKAYQLLIDKIDVGFFQEYLYELVENTDLGVDSLLFEFVSINYKRKDYQKILYNLMSDRCSEEELLSLKIYSSCININDSEKDDIILASLEDLDNLYVQNGYTNDMLYEFYILNDSFHSTEYNYYDLSKEEVLIETKKHSKKVISKFNFYKGKENWSDFLDCIIEKEI